MKLTLNNAQPALAADHAALGAAIKIIVAGGSDLSPEAQKRASGLTDYNWTRKGNEVLRLVDLMDAQAAEV